MKKKRPSRGGRPKGSKGTYTRAGDPIEDNLRRAIFGPLADSADIFWIHQLWASQNPSELVRAENATLHNGEQIQANVVRRWSHELGEEIARRLAKRDSDFFVKLAKQACRYCVEGSWQHDIVRTILLAHVAIEQCGNPERRFTMRELRDIDWKGNSPSERQLKRLVDELKIPMLRGRSKKK